MSVMAVEAAKIAIVDFADRWTNVDALRQTLDKFGVAYDDMTNALASGQLHFKAEHRVFLIGSFTTDSDVLHQGLDKNAQVIQDFVKNGGIVWEPTQADQHQANVDWLPPELRCVRGDNDNKDFTILATDHPLFNEPNRMNDDMFKDWGYSGWPTVWEVITSQNGFDVLVESLGEPVIMEAIYGKGKFLMMSIAPDIYHIVGNNDNTKNMAGLFMENLLNYVEADSQPTTRLTVEPDDHSNTRKDATLLSFSDNAHTVGEIAPSSDVDYFSVEVRGEGELIVYSIGHTDVVGQLQDSNGNFLTSSSNDGDNLNFRIVYNVMPGTYYIKVTELNKDETGDYGIQATFTSFEAGVDYPDFSDGFHEAVRVVTYSPSGDVLVTGDNANEIHVLNPSTGNSIRVLETGDEGKNWGINWGDIRSIAFSPDGRWCAVGTAKRQGIHGVSETIPGKFLVWNRLKNTWADAAAWGVPFVYDKIEQVHEVNTVRGVAFSPDSQYLAVGTDGDQVFIQKYRNRLGWDQNIQVLDHADNVTSVAWLPHPNRYVVATGCDDGKVRLWDLQKSNSEMLIQSPNLIDRGKIHCLSFSHDGTHNSNRTKLAVGCDDGNIVLFVLIEQWFHQSSANKQHDDAVLSLDFHPSGNVLVSTGGDGAISFLDVNTGTSLNGVKSLDEDAKISSVAFKPTGDVLAIGTEGKLGFGGVVPRVYQFPYTGTTAFTNKANFNLDIPSNLISEVAYSENATYFVLNLQKPSVTSDKQISFFRNDCIVTLDLPDVRQAPVSAENETDSRLDNPQYFMYSLQTPRQRIDAINISQGDTKYKVLTSAIGGVIGVGIGAAIGSLLPGAGTFFGAGIGKVAGTLAARAIGSVSGQLIGVGLRKVGLGSGFFDDPEAAEKDRILAETADPFFLLQPTNDSTSNEDKYRVLFLIEKRITEIGITVEQGYRLERDGPVYVAKYTRVWNLESGTWSAPSARPMALADYPPFQELPPEEQAYLLRRFGGTVNMNAEQLHIPEETALLSNYPNPFNPETWIPYQLAKPADVTLTIYDINGRVVRNLDLGHQRAGMYQRRTRAAYWDGKNAVGEPVASGVYFYTLTAGDFNATRKMLIRK